MEGAEVGQKERRSMPQGYYCPVCGANIKKSSSATKKFDDLTRCAKCKNRIVIQKNMDNLMIFLDRRAQIRA